MKPQTKNTMIGLMFLLLPLVATPACSSNQGQQGGPGGGPPPEAIKACEGKKVGDSVTFKGRQGESLKATCKEIEGKLAALPENGPDGGPPKRN